MAQGRMLRKKISTDRRLCELIDQAGVEAGLIYTWCIPHLDAEGRMVGDPELIKSIVFPRHKQITTDHVEAALKVANKLGLIEWYEVNGDCYIWVTGFDKNQNIRKDRECKSEIPPPPKTPGILPAIARSTPGELPASSGQREVKGREVNLSEVKKSEEKLSKVNSSEINLSKEKTTEVNEIKKEDFIFDKKEKAEEIEIKNKLETKDIKSSIVVEPNQAIATNKQGDDSTLTANNQALNTAARVESVAITTSEQDSKPHSKQALTTTKDYDYSKPVPWEKYKSIPPLSPEVLDQYLNLERFREKARKQLMAIAFELP